MATCLACIPERQWTSNRDGKTMQQYHVEMDNGEVGECSVVATNPAPFIAGQTANYTAEDNGRGGKKFKPVRTFGGGFGGGGQGGGGGKNDEAILAQVALKAAVELVCAGKVEVGVLEGTTVRCAQIIKNTINVLKAG
jgi:hypothetical protein